MFELPSTMTGAQNPGENNGEGRQRKRGRGPGAPGGAPVEGAVAGGQKDTARDGGEGEAAVAPLRVSDFT